jgi:hypothetical protein
VNGLVTKLHHHCSASAGCSALYLYVNSVCIAFMLNMVIHITYNTMI